MLRKRLDWEPKDDSAAKATGCSLLLCATLANDVEAVRMLLQERGPADVNTPVKNPDLKGLIGPFKVAN